MKQKNIYIILIIIVVIHFIIFATEHIYILLFLNPIYIIWNVISLIYVTQNYKNSFKNIKEYEYYRNIDFKKISAVASGILMHTENTNVNTIITAIYELSEKKIIRIEWKEQKNFLKLEEHNKEKINKLLSYEKSIIRFIFENLEDTKEYSLEDILKEAEENSTKNYILKSIEKEIKNYINKTYLSKIEENLNSYLEMIGYILCILVTILEWPIALVATFNITDSICLVLVIEYLINLSIFIYYIKTKFLKPEYKEEFQKLYGLYSYMSDYSLLHEQEIKFYQLYNSYYVYAMGLGLADKFEKELGQATLNNEVRTALQFYKQNRRNI